MTISHLAKDTVNYLTLEHSLAACKCLALKLAILMWLKVTWRPQMESSSFWSSGCSPGFCVTRAMASGQDWVLSFVAGSLRWPLATRLSSLQRLFELTLTMMIRNSYDSPSPCPQVTEWELEVTGLAQGCPARALAELTLGSICLTPSSELSPHTL